jgi:hypothetical protein
VLSERPHAHVVISTGRGLAGTGELIIAGAAIRWSCGYIHHNAGNYNVTNRTSIILRGKVIGLLHLRKLLNHMEDGNMRIT